MPAAIGPPADVVATSARSAAATAVMLRVKPLLSEFGSVVSEVIVAEFGQTVAVGRRTSKVAVRVPG